MSVTTHNFPLGLAAAQYRLHKVNVSHTKVSKFQMLGTDSNNFASDLMYHKKFIELFPTVKSVKLRDLAFFVRRRNQLRYMTNWLFKRASPFWGRRLFVLHSEAQIHVSKSKNILGYEHYQKSCPCYRSRGGGSFRESGFNFWIESLAKSLL